MDIIGISTGIYTQPSPTNTCVKHNQMCDARKCNRYHSHFVTHVTWSKLLLIKYRYQRYIYIYIHITPTSNTQIK